MTQEEFERIKDEEKKHLRKLKELKALLRDLERRKNAYTALETMSQASREAFDVQAEMLHRLAVETAEAEARLEVALESIPTSDHPGGDVLSRPEERRDSDPDVPWGGEAGNPTPEKTIGRMR